MQVLPRRSEVGLEVPRFPDPQVRPAHALSRKPLGETTSSPSALLLFCYTCVYCLSFTSTDPLTSQKPWGKHCGREDPSGR